MQGWTLLAVIVVAIDVGFILGGWLRGVLDQPDQCRHCRDWPTCANPNNKGA